MHRPRFHIRGAGLILLLISLGAAGQTQPPPTPVAAESSGTGAITGRVVNESGQPLPNASVMVQAVGSNRPEHAASTDRDGNFKVTGLERVPYMVFAQVPAYVSAARDPGAQTNQQYNVGDSVTFVLIKGGVITGTVTNSAGEPVVAVGVRVQMIRDSNGRRLPAPAGGRITSTDDRGVYRAFGLRAGTYIVMAGGTNEYARTAINAFAFDVPTYAPSSSRENAAEISVRSGEETTNIDIRYRGERGRIISGITSGPHVENAAVNVTLTAISENGPQRDTTSFQQWKSEFTFTGLPDGDYYLTAWARARTGEVAVSESKAITLSGADLSGIELVPRPMASVAGRVVLDEAKVTECTEKTRPALKEMFVSAWHSDNQAAKNQPQFLWSLGVPVHPDEQGNVVIKNLAAGQYYFAARSLPPSLYIQSISLAPATQSAKPGKAIDATRIWTTVRSGERLPGLTITLAQGGASLRGRLVLAEGETRPETLFIYLVPTETERANDILRYFGTAVPADGKITLNNLAPGRYWVLAKPGPDGVTTATSPLTKLRFPDETETRARLRREAEAAKNEIEFKPCQNVVGFKLPLKALVP